MAKKTKAPMVAQSLMIPPPPAIPMQGGGQPIFTPMTPQTAPVDQTPAPAGGNYVRPVLPKLSRGDLSSILDYKPDPALQEATGLARQGVTAAQSAADQAKAQYGTALNNWQATQQPSPFEDFIKQSLQKKMIDSLGSENSFGSRFNRGFDTGQKIAANIVGPAIGLLSKGAGGVGALQATQQMREQVAASERQRSAESNAINSSLANLAAMYENVDPKSAKNASAAFKTHLELAKWKMEMQNKASDDLRQATQAFGTAAHNQNQAGLEGAKARSSALLGLYGHDVTEAGLENNINQFEAGLPEKVAKDGRDAQRLRNETTGVDLRKQEVALSGQREKDKLAQDKVINGHADTKEQMQAMDSLRKITGDVRAKMSAVGANGEPRYPNYGALLKEDKVLQSTISKYKQIAGLGEFTDEQALGMMAPPEAPAEPSGGDILGGIGNAVGSVAKGAKQMLFGSGPSQQAAAPRVLTPEEAFELYKKQRGAKNGR